MDKFIIAQDSKRQAAGQKLLEAAQEFWGACHEEGQYGAVQWLTGSSGQLLISARRVSRNADGQHQQTSLAGRRRPSIREG